MRLLFIMAFLVPEGFQHSPRGTRDNMVLAMKTDMEVRPPHSFILSSKPIVLIYYRPVSSHVSLKKSKP